MPDRTPVEGKSKDVAGIRVQPVAWVGKGGVLELRELDGTRSEICPPVTIPAGSLVLIVPPPAGFEFAQQVGIIPEPGKLVTPFGPH